MMSSVVPSLGAALLILAGLLLPGFAWAHAARWPLRWFAGGVISLLGIFGALLTLTLCRVPVTGGTLIAWQAALGAGGAYWWWRRRGIPVEPCASIGTGWWLALPVLPMVGVAVWRAVWQPLSGADVGFRWNHLAVLIVRSGGLDHYPPLTSGDFSHYFWPDGIAPLLASGYAWTYLVAGSTAKTWTAIPVLLQTAGLLLIVHALGRLWGGPRGGWLACALAGGTMLLQFSFNLGQETGLTALGVGGLAYYLLEWERTRRGDLLFPAAACAALAACAREYGLIFPVVATVWLLAARAGWRRALVFAWGALALPAAWHLRNWVRTGNPFYAHDTGFFPTNPVFAAWMRSYIAFYGPALHGWAAWGEVGRLIARFALPAALGLLAGIFLRPRAAGWTCMLALAAAGGFCWLVSVPYTAGGVFYSMRVLSPVLLLGCAWGGARLASFASGKIRLIAVWFACFLFGFDAALRAWTIPANPYRTPIAEWPMAGYSLQEEFEQVHRPFFTAAARAVSGRVLSEAASAPPVFLLAGREVVPMWSPEVAFLFKPGVEGDAVAQLRARGFSHVLLTRVPSTVNFLERTGAMARLNGHLQPVMANDTFILFALQP